MEVQESVEQVRVWLDEAEMTDAGSAVMETAERMNLLSVRMLARHFYAMQSERGNCPEWEQSFFDSGHNSDGNSFMY